MAGPALMPIIISQTPQLTLLSTFFSTSDSFQYTDTAVDLGREAADRLIIVSVASTHGEVEHNMFSLSVAGNSLNEDVFTRNLGNSVNGVVGIYSAVIPSGTSGDVVVTWTGAVRCTMIGTYRADNLTSTALFDSDTAEDGNMSLNIPSRGVAFGCAGAVSGGSSCTWTGLNEDMDEPEQSFISIASAGPLAAETGRIIQATAAGGPSRYCCASYG